MLQCTRYCMRPTPVWRGACCPWIFAACERGGDACKARAIAVRRWMPPIVGRAVPVVRSAPDSMPSITQSGVFPVNRRSGSDPDPLGTFVEINGDAISEQNRDRIFDAFFTTRRDSGGTGMGLAIVQSLLRANGGSIRLLRPDRGAAFEVQFPAG
jgi:hypothetical protein